MKARAVKEISLVQIAGGLEEGYISLVIRAAELFTRAEQAPDNERARAECEAFRKYVKCEKLHTHAEEIAHMTKALNRIEAALK